MTPLEPPGVAEPDTTDSPVRLDRRRALVGGVVLVAVFAAAGIAVYRDRHSFSSSLHRFGPAAVAAGVGFGMIGVAAQLPTWREVLGGLGARIPLAPAARVFFVSQLGKYVPGSVWPTVMQMEAGRRLGFSRRTVLGGNLVTVVISCSVGLMVAGLVLPFYDSRALAHYWWSLLVLPPLIALMHPRALPALLDRGFAVLHRPPLDERLEAGAEAKAAGWALVSWLGFGGQLSVLVAAQRPLGVSTVLLCIGAVSLAVPLGVLFIPAPAGAGVRDVVLALVLGSVMGPGQALAVVIASRALTVVCDVLMAGVAAAGFHLIGADRRVSR